MTGPATPGDGDPIATYELIRRIGVGGMGEVWLGRGRDHTGALRDVAVKRLLPDALTEPDAVAMFLQESRIARRLRHPNVVNPIEVGSADTGEPCLVLEYVDGTELQKLLRDPATRPSVAGALIIGRDIALALHAAHTLTDDAGHELGLVHRDVTPSNMMLDRRGQVKLMDFGIAKVRAHAINRTGAGVIKGKLSYLAPEQTSGDVDGRSDLFALGLVLWELVAGRPARAGTSEAAIMTQVALDSVPSILTVVPWLPPRVAAVIDRACSFEPAARYQSGEEMAQALVAVFLSLPEAGSLGAVREALGARVSRVLSDARGEHPRGTQGEPVLTLRIRPADSANSFSTPPPPPDRDATARHSLVELPLARRRTDPVPVVTAPRPTPVVPAPVRSLRLPLAVVLVAASVLAVLVAFRGYLRSDRRAPNASTAAPSLTPPAVPTRGTASPATP